MTFHRSHYNREINETVVGKTVTIAGWIEDIRDIGKIVFLIIKDITGTVQVVVQKNKIEDINGIPRQSALIIEGVVQKSMAKDFPFEIKMDKIVYINKAIHPLPIDPTGRVESSFDKRLDSRALDLRNQTTSSIFLIRSKTLEIIRNYFRDLRFIEVNTPKIIGSASEGGANLFGFDYFKSKGYLAQSPQLYKEQLILALDRVFEISHYFRAENSNTVRHLSEFLSIDIEAAFLDYKDIMNIMEELIKKLFVTIKEYIINENLILEKPIIEIDERKKFEQITYNQCIIELNKLGEDIKFGEDLSDLALRKLGEKFNGFFFITDWPLNLKPFYIHEHDDDERLSKSFDLQFGYLELISGGTRQHDPKKLKSRLLEQNLDPKNFEDHLKTFEWGMPPHSGCGLGLDRLLMVLTNSNNIREVVLYPRDPDRITP